VPVFANAEVCAMIGEGARTVDAGTSFEAAEVVRGDLAVPLAIAFGQDLDREGVWAPC
jgi:hypothetical protein